MEDKKYYSESERIADIWELDEDIPIASQPELTGVLQQQYNMHMHGISEEHKCSFEEWLEQNYPDR